LNHKFCAIIAVLAFFCGMAFKGLTVNVLHFLQDFFLLSIIQMYSGTFIFHYCRISIGIFYTLSDQRITVKPYRRQLNRIFRAFTICNIQFWHIPMYNGYIWSKLLSLPVHSLSHRHYSVIISLWLCLNLKSSVCISCFLLAHHYDTDCIQSHFQKSAVPLKSYFMLSQTTIVRNYNPEELSANPCNANENQLCTQEEWKKPIIKTVVVGHVRDSRVCQATVASWQSLCTAELRRTTMSLWLHLAPTHSAFVCMV